MKKLWQRFTKGYTDEDVWSFDYYLAKIIPPALRELKKGYGCPSDFYDPNNKNNECAKWHETLEEIAQGFESAQFLKTAGYMVWKKKGTAHILSLDEKSLQDAKKKMDKGLKLFAEHYLNLWD